MMKFINALLYLGLIFVFMVIMFSFGGCTENSRVKNFGGKGTITLEEGRKLVNITWKENNLWILTKPMRFGDVAETYEFSEQSSLGIIEGTYVIIEVK